MNKLTIALALLAINLVNAQDKITYYGVIDKYKLEYLENELTIRFSKINNDGYSLIIDAHSFDNLSPKGSFSLKNKQHDDFISYLKEAKQKYIEWIEVAEKNNIKEFDKYMDLKCESNGSLFYFGDELTADLTVELKFKFTINPDKGITTPLLIVETGKLVSLSNEFITSKGLGIVFSSVSEIDTFLSKISKDKMISLMNEAPKSDLFK